jgi:hypothetical protein
VLARPKPQYNRFQKIIHRWLQNIANGLVGIAHVANGLASTLIITGDAFEAISQGLGMAVEDSFRTLDGVSSTIQAGTKYLLKTKRPTTIKATGPIDPQNSYLYSNTKSLRRIGGDVIIPAIKKSEKKLSSMSNAVDISMSDVNSIGEADTDFTEDSAGDAYH